MKNTALNNGVKNNGAALNNKEDLSINTNTIVNNNNVQVKGDVNMSKELLNKELSLKATSFMKIEFLKSAGQYEEAAKELERLAKMPRLSLYNGKAKTLKQVFKKMEVFLMQGIEFTVIDNKLIATPKVQAPQETELIRTVGVEALVMADEDMALAGKGNRTLLSIKINKELLKAANKDYFIALFDLLIKGFYVVYNTQTGKATYSMTKPQVKDDKHIAYRYQFLGVTPSGLRTASIMTAATAIITKDGIVEDDRRVEILDKALHGAFKKEFVSYDENGNVTFKEDTLDKIFKDFTRVLQSAPASKPLFTAKNYIIVDNIAKHAKYNAENYNIQAITEGVNCEDTQDGASLISIEALRNFFKKDGKNFSFQDIASIVLQLRGASAKKSGIAKSRKHLSTLFHTILFARGVIAHEEGLYKDLKVKEAGLKALVESKKPMIIVNNGVRYEGSEITMELVKDTLKHIEILADWNAYKLSNFNPEFKVLALKQGYVSETKLNTVVNLMLQSVCSEKAYAILSKKVKLAINKKLSSVGIIVEADEEGNIIDLSIDANKLATVNNDSQFAQFLVKNNPLKLTQIAPQIMKSLIGNVLISIKNVINLLNPEIESHYTVVQSDPAVLFGCRLLGDRELFCNDFYAPKVSGVRHPISSMLAVSTFEMVTFEEIVKRINNLNVAPQAKDYMREHFQFSKGFCTIPASHDIMEKHDGMDFDIDAMQIIVDKEVVEVLSEIKDISTVIDRSFDVKSNISTQKSKAESVLESFRSGKIESLGSFVNESEIKVAGNNPLARSFKKQLTASKRLYDMSQDSVATIVRDYFLNPIASVGMIATGFYNNAMILNFLKSDASTEIKEKIASIFRYEYGCHGVSNYVSPFVLDKSEEGHDTIILHKENCTRVMFNYANSKGTVADTIAFLDDCAKANRYPAETSIDSAKNMYQIVDMFNHGHLVKALGSDKNAKIELESNDEEFASIVKQLNSDFGSNFSMINTFDIKLLTINHETVLVDELTPAQIITAVKENKASRSNNEKPLCIGVKDSFALLKEELVEYTNFLNVLAIKTVEDVANSDEAKKMRSELIIENAKLMISKKIGEVDKIFNSILATSIIVNEVVSSSFDFDEKNSNLYKKNEAIKILKNTASLMFDGYTKEEKGLATMAYIAKRYEDRIEKSEKVSTVNSTILSVFEEEILAYLDSIGWNVTAGEKILSIIEDSKLVKASEVDGAYVVFEDGVGTIEDTDYIVTSENKHSNASGTIKIIDGHAYVTFERETLERDSSLGIYLSTKVNAPTRFLAKKAHMDIFDEVVFQKKTNATVQGRTRTIYSRLQGIKDGKSYALCELFTNKNVAEILDSLENGSYEIFYSKKDGDNNCFVHFNAEGLADIIDDTNDDNDENIISFGEIAEVTEGNTEDIFAALAEDLIEESALPTVTDENDIAPIVDVNTVDAVDNIFGALSDFIIQ